MSWNILKLLVTEDDDHLTEIGLECKQLAIRISTNEGYVLTEQDKEILDSLWMKLWK